MTCTGAPSKPSISTTRRPATVLGGKPTRSAGRAASEHRKRCGSTPYLSGGGVLWPMSLAAALSMYRCAGTICRVTLVLGNKERFALELGEQREGLCRVDTWAAGQWLTCDDNMAYVPQIQRSIQRDYERLDSIEDSSHLSPGVSLAAVHRRQLTDEGELRERWQFLTWGPTTDNVLAHLLRYGNHLVMTVGFWREDHLRRHLST